MTKVISLENLQEFKTKCDETYAPIGGGGGNLYRHDITAQGVNDTTDYSMHITLYTSSAEPITNLYDYTASIGISGLGLYNAGAVINSNWTEYYNIVYLDVGGDGTILSWARCIGMSWPKPGTASFKALYFEYYYDEIIDRVSKV